MRCERENICIGHLAPQNKRCYGCKSDEDNLMCEDYKSVGLYVIKLDTVPEREELLK